VLEAERAAHGPGIELLRGDKPDDLPVALPLPEFLKRGVSDIADVIFTVFFIKEHTAGRNKA